MPTPFQQRVLRDLAAIGHDVDVTGGGTLQEGGTQMADMFRDSAVKQGRGAMAARMLKTIFSARHALPLLALHDTALLGTAFLREQHREQGDTDFLRGREPDRSRVVRGFARRMMQFGSGFANEDSVENFRTAMAMHDQGADITWEITPHTSELDPVFVEAIVHDAGRTTSLNLRKESSRFLEENIVVIGHKVRLSVIHRIFAGAVNSISILAPKYREGVSKEEEEVLRAQGRVINRIMAGIHQHRNMMMLRCPEGGRMRRDHRIGLYATVEPAPAYMVPLHLQMPFNFVGVDEPSPEAHRPARVELYCGAPYQAEGKSTSERATNRVQRLHDSLAAVGAHVGRYSWHLKRVAKLAPGTLDRAAGAPETYTEILPRREEV